MLSILVWFGSVRFGFVIFNCPSLTKKVEAMDLKSYNKACTDFYFFDQKTIGTQASPSRTSLLPVKAQNVHAH